MHLKLTRTLLIGSIVRNPGDVIQAEGSYAEHLTRSGAGIPVTDPASIAKAVAPPRTPERAVAQRQR